MRTDLYFGYFGSKFCYCCEKLKTLKIAKLLSTNSPCHTNTWWLIGQQLLFNISDHKKPLTRASRFGGSLSVEPPGGRARPWPQIGCCVFQCPNACPSSLTGHPGLPGMKVSEISLILMLFPLSDMMCVFIFTSVTIYLMRLFCCSCLQGHKGFKGESGEPGRQGHKVTSSLFTLRRSVIDYCNR